MDAGCGALPAPGAAAGCAPRDSGPLCGRSAAPAPAAGGGAATVVPGGGGVPASPGAGVPTVAFAGAGFARGTFRGCVVTAAAPGGAVPAAPAGGDVPAAPGAGVPTSAPDGGTAPAGAPPFARAAAGEAALTAPLPAADVDAVCAQPAANATAESSAARRKQARMGPTLSVVAPLYDEEGNVAELIRRLTAVASGIAGIESYELVLVNDGSKDATLALLREHAARDPHLVVVDLSRNFGHQLAATAGLDVSRGDVVVLIDADLQDPPELIPEMIARWREGYDVVYAVRRNRQGESAFKLLTARMFYRITRRLTKVSIPVDTGDFRLMSRRVVDALQGMRERHRFIRGLVAWLGFPQAAVYYDRNERHAGSSKYPVSKMLRFAIDGITSFSDVPLRIATWFGFIVSAVAFVVAIVEILIRVFTGYNLPGYTSTIFAILFLGGVQLIGIGILGEYVGRIHDEIKGRPLYLISTVERSGESVPVPVRERRAEAIRRF